MEINESRSAATALMWLSYLGFLWFMSGSLGAWVVALAFVAMLPLIVMTVFMWGSEVMMGGRKNQQVEMASDTESEKRKRDVLDRVLRELSDEDLHRLRERLQDGVIDDDVLYDRMVGDDGELVIRDKRS